MGECHALEDGSTMCRQIRKPNMSSFSSCTVLVTPYIEFPSQISSSAYSKYCKSWQKLVFKKILLAPCEIWQPWPFMQDLKKYMMQRSTTWFDPVFVIFGIFYNQCYLVRDPKMSFCIQNFEPKFQFLMYFYKWWKWALWVLKSQNQCIATIK